MIILRKKRVNPTTIMGDFVLEGLKQDSFWCCVLNLSVKKCRPWRVTGCVSPGDLSVSWCSHIPEKFCANGLGCSWFLRSWNWTNMLKIPSSVGLCNQHFSEDSLHFHQFLDVEPGWIALAFISGVGSDSHRPAECDAPSLQWRPSVKTSHLANWAPLLSIDQSHSCFEAFKSNYTWTIYTMFFTVYSWNTVCSGSLCSCVLLFGWEALE